MDTEYYTPLGIGAGTLIAGRYEVVRRLGAGATSIVLEVRDNSLNRARLALKLFSPRIGGDAKLIERFRNEVLITRKLTHPNIVRTYDFGEAGSDQCYVTMEYVDGSSLDAVIEKAPAEGGLEPNEIVRILYEVAEGVAYAHGQGVIHRDLKPANILISRSGEVKITDYGLARSSELAEGLTETGHCVGTPFYMAPEQVLQHAIDHRVDIYALGIIGFEMVTGSVPFREQAWFNLASQIVSEEVPCIVLKRSGAPMWFSDFVRKASAKRPEDRFSSAEEIVCLFGDYLTPTEQRTRVSPRFEKREGLGGRLLLCLRSHGLGIALLLVIALLLALVLDKGRRTAADLSGGIEQQTNQIRRFTHALREVREVVVDTATNKIVITGTNTEDETPKKEKTSPKLKSETIEPDPDAIRPSVEVK